MPQSNGSLLGSKVCHCPCIFGPLQALKLCAFDWRFLGSELAVGSIRSQVGSRRSARGTSLDRRNRHEMGWLADGRSCERKIKYRTNSLLHRAEEKLAGLAMEAVRIHECFHRLTYDLVPFLVRSDTALTSGVLSKLGPSYSNSLSVRGSIPNSAVNCISTPGPTKRNRNRPSEPPPSGNSSKTPFSGVCPTSFWVYNKGHQ